MESETIRPDDLFKVLRNNGLPEGPHGRGAFNGHDQLPPRHCVAVDGLLNYTNKKEKTVSSLVLEFEFGLYLKLYIQCDVTKKMGFRKGVTVGFLQC